ncbi:MAG: EmrA/EmrK family multidrug efflux transporter periplasmic adaptor subunit, partial [Comamonadaceae bacterium]
AQNATGNWIKVVQRVPVRIALDAEQLKANPLRVGLSMDAEVDVSEKGGKALADAPRNTAFAQTQVYATADGDADAEVARIIAANMGRPVPAQGASAPAAVQGEAKSSSAHTAAQNGSGAKLAMHHAARG